ncbi:MAG: helix-turn-helix domain-containing protein, partial [Candidatus Egerieousia sp.]
MKSSKSSLAQLSNKTGIAASTISNYRRGTRECGINNLALLARYLNVSADYLLGLDNDLEENFTASTSDCSLLDEIQSSRDFSNLVQAYEEYQNDHRIALRLKAQAMALSYYEDDARIPPDELQKILPAWNPDELKQAQKRESIQLGKVKMVLNKIL